MTVLTTAIAKCIKPNGERAVGQVGFLFVFYIYIRHRPELETFTTLCTLCTRHVELRETGVTIGQPYKGFSPGMRT